MVTVLHGVAAGSAVDRLTQMVEAEDRFTHASEDLLQTQIEAMNERFQERRDRIKLLGHRAREAGITEIRSLEDVVPLLFPHTAYKSYPDSFLIEEKWDRLARWLGTITPSPVPAIDASEVAGIDDWVAGLEAAGLFVSCSSGTTGNPAVLPASRPDMEWTATEGVAAFAWGSGVEPARDRRMMFLAPVASVARNQAVIGSQTAAFGEPGREPFRLPNPPITIGSQTKMVVLRRRMVEGTAMPEEVAEYERTSKERAEILERAMVAAAEAMIRHREEKLFITGYWNAQYQVAKAVRDMGFGGKDFHPDNCMYVGGGLKRAQLPDDYQEFVLETFNIPSDRQFQMYGMQEINSTMPRCVPGGRYHVPPWLVPLILDRDGETLVPRTRGEVEGRAAFFDLSLDGRWGGVISGDKISLSYEPCACGNASPSIRGDIARFADLEGDDKISCSGTVDAYVRGMA